MAIDVDIRENAILQQDPVLLETLLIDRSRPKNGSKKPQYIIWATNHYESLGPAYAENEQITVEAITGDNVYGEDKTIDGIVVNDKCKSLACKIREIIDAKSSFADWLDNQNIRNQLKQDIKICLVKNGYPPQYTPEVFREVMDQVENFKKNED